MHGKTNSTTLPLGTPNFTIAAVGCWSHSLRLSADTAGILFSKSLVVLCVQSAYDLRSATRPGSALVHEVHAAAVLAILTDICKCAGRPVTSGSAAHTHKLGTAASVRNPEGEQAEGEEDKENDHAAVTAVIWKELAELSAAQAKLKVVC